MWANLSFDWRKCQFLFAISAINVVCGLNVVTRGVRLTDTLSLACRLSSCVSETQFAKLWKLRMDTYGSVSIQPSNGV